MDFEARLGDVLVKLKPTDLDDLSYSSQSKAVDFERWAQLTRMNLESRHSQLVAWWDLTYHNAQVAYNGYLQLPPLRRSEIRPTSDGFDNTLFQVERYMRRHVLRCMPMHIQQTLLHMVNVSCSDVLFQAMVDAGPGTEQDRAITLNNVGSKGPAVPVQQIYEKLHSWRFSMMRLGTLGVTLPDPSVQRNVLIHYVSKLSEADGDFHYRLNAYRMNFNLQGAVTQHQVDELWRYLVAEAREVHGQAHKEQTKRQQPKTPSGTQPAGNVPEGAGQPAAEPEATKRIGDGKGKGTG